MINLPYNIALTHRLPTIAKDCTLEAIDNGEITGDLPLKPGATATLKCGADYRLEGTAEIECVAGNQFLNVLPSCVGEYCGALV